MKKIFIKTIILKIILILAFFNFSLVNSGNVFAAINPEINYQGRLLDDLGDPVADTDFNIQFKLYTVDTGGTEIWTETHCYSPDSGATCDGTGVDSRITTRDGLFSVMLGSVNSLSGVDFNQTLYLGINIGGTGGTPSYDGEMTPRKVLGAVPAAFEAGKLNGITSDQFFRNDILNSTSSATTSLAIRQNGAGKVAEFFGSSGDSLFTVQSNGNVGIGTTSPSQKLAVSGNGIIGDGTGGTNFTVTGSSGNLTVSDGSIIDTTRSTLYFANATPKMIDFNNSKQIFFSDGGFSLNGSNAGLGIADRGGVTNTFTLYNTGGLLRFYDNADRLTLTQNTGNLNLVTGALQVSTTTASSYFMGGVGIGTTTPSTSLTIQGESGKDMFSIASSAGANLLTFNQSGNLEIGTTASISDTSIGFNNSTFLLDNYLNFSSTLGSSGFGLRNNAGVIEYKDSSGAWIPLNEIGQETYGYVKFSDVKSDGTDAGTATAGSWFTRTLNTEENDSIGSTLSSDTFTLPAGTYRIDAKVPGFHVNGHQSRLYNVTDAAVSLLGSNSTAVNLLSATHSFINGVITIDSEKTFRIEQRVQTTRANDGRGSDNGFAGNDEVYTVIEVSSLTAESAASGSWTVNGSDIYFNSGKVGVGTTTPDVLFDVSQNSSSGLITSYPLIRAYNQNPTAGDGSSTYNRSALRLDTGNGAVQANLLATYESGGSFPSGLYVRTATNHPIYFTTNNTTRLIVSESGDVGIGTTTPQRKLHVEVDSDVAPVRFQDSNGYCEINPTSTTWTCTSDERLKENIRDVASTTPDLYENMMKLRPVTFEWKTDETNTARVGLIAQEVEVIFPEFVTTDSETGLKTVAYGSFVPYLISVIQELANKIDEIAKRIDEIDLVGGFIAKLTIGSSEKPTGVTLYDEVTGDPYCMSVRNGDMVTKFGECTEESQEPVGNSNDDLGERPYIFNSDIEEDESPDLIFEDEVIEVEEISEIEEVAEVVEIEDVNITEEISEAEEVEEVQVIFETNNSSGSVELNL